MPTLEEEALLLVARIRDDATTPLKRIKDSIRGMKDASDGPREMSRHFRDLEDRMGRVRKMASEGVRSAFDSVGQSALVAGASVGGFFLLLRNFGTRGAEMADFARKAQLPIDVIRSYERLGDSLGIEQERVRTALSTMTDHMGEFRRHTGQLYAQVRGWYPQEAGELAALSESAEGNAAALQKWVGLVDKIRREKGNWAARSVAKEIFGDDAVVDMLAMSGGMEGMAAAIAKYTAEMAKFDPGAAQQFRTNLSALSNVLDDLKTTVGNEVLPEFTKGLRGIGDFFRDNQGDISKGFREGIKELKGDFAVAAPFLRTMFEGLDFVAQKFGGWVPLVTKLVEIRVAWWALTSAAALAPLLAELLLITAALAGAEKASKWLAGGEKKIAEFEAKPPKERMGGTWLQNIIPMVDWLTGGLLLGKDKEARKLANPPLLDGNMLPDMTPTPKGSAKDFLRKRQKGAEADLPSPGARQVSGSAWPEGVPKDFGAGANLAKEQMEDAVAKGVLRGMRDWSIFSGSGGGAAPGGGGSSGGGDGSGDNPFKGGMRRGHGGHTGAEGLRGRASGGSGGDGAGSRSFRNNNPGNIKFGDFAKAHGATGADSSGFAIFPDEGSGKSAQAALWGTSRYSNMSLDQAARLWSGGGYGASKLGFDGNRKFGDLSAPEREKLFSAQRQAEGWFGGGGSGGRSGMDPMARAGSGVMRGGTTVITTPSGRRFTVASQFAANFQGFLNAYEGAGGVVGPNSGGLSARAGNASYHPIGRAIDINQIARDVRRGGKTLPAEQEDALAKQWGIYPGHLFRGSPDAGHFEVRSAKDAAEALRRQRARQPGALLMHQGGGGQIKVAGSGHIRVDVNAPKGTKVAATSAGLFDTVELNRGFGMTEAQQA